MLWQGRNYRVGVLDCTSFSRRLLGPVEESLGGGLRSRSLSLSLSLSVPLSPSLSLSLSLTLSLTLET